MPAVKKTYRVHYKPTGKKFRDDEQEIKAGIHGTFPFRAGDDPKECAEAGMKACLKYFNELAIPTIGRDGAGQDQVISKVEYKGERVVAWIEELHNGRPKGMTSAPKAAPEEDDDEDEEEEEDEEAALAVAKK